MRHFGAPLPTGDFHTQLLTAHEQQGSFDLPDTLLPFTCPTGGCGDNRPTQLTLLGSDGNPCTRLTYRSHGVYAGKKLLPGLPATYAEAPQEAETLELFLADELRNAEAGLRYTLFAHRPALAASLEIVNHGQEPLVLTEAASVCASLPGPYEMIHLYGAWGRERWLERTPPMHGERTIGSRRGAQRP
jgi:alpha-galactosidase